MQNLGREYISLLMEGCFLVNDYGQMCRLCLTKIVIRFYAKIDVVVKLNLALNRVTLSS